MVKEKQEEKETKTDDLKLKGKFISAVGRRKTSVAVVRLFKKGDGSIVVNGKKAEDYFSANYVAGLKQPLKLTNHGKDLGISVVASGGGLKGQADAVRHGISRALVEFDEELKTSIKTKGYLSRDPRKKERKKPGLKKARRAPQWSKR
jgi:small subunit ribosomal protein S9